MIGMYKPRDITGVKFGGCGIILEDAIRTIIKIITFKFKFLICLEFITYST